LFEDQAVKTIAEIAFQLNMNHGNYGARRLYGCVEKVLEDITYLSSPNKRISVTITKEYVENHLYKS
jgi:ATP-dependent HslUV protease ATP-binding subunit HslU